MKPVKRIAAINDICSFGKVSLGNIIPILSVMGYEVSPIPTIILSTHTGGFGIPKIKKMPEFVEMCNDHFQKLHLNFEGIFVGYLGSVDCINSTEEFLNSNRESLIVLDPIFGDYGNYYSNFGNNYVENIKRLMPLSDIITPNYTEACFLTDELYEDKYDYNKIKRVCSKLYSLGCNNIVITSIPLEDKNKIGIAVFQKGVLVILERDRLGKSYPGTGDIFTAVLVGQVLDNNDLYDSVIKAHEFTNICIEESIKYDYSTKEGVLLEKNLKFLL